MPDKDNDQTTTTASAEPTERRILPSEIESASARYGLSGPEAERFVRDGDDSPEAANRLKAERVVYRQAFEAVSYGNVTRRADLAGGADLEPGDADPTQPTSGPYGPNVNYSTVEAPLDKDHVVVAAPVTSAAKAVGTP